MKTKLFLNSTENTLNKDTITPSLQRRNSLTEVTEIPQKYYKQKSMRRSSLQFDVQSNRNSRNTLYSGEEGFPRITTKTDSDLIHDEDNIEEYIAIPYDDSNLNKTQNNELQIPPFLKCSRPPVSTRQSSNTDKTSLADDLAIDNLALDIKKTATSSDIVQTDLHCYDSSNTSPVYGEKDNFSFHTKYQPPLDTISESCELSEVTLPDVDQIEDNNEFQDIPLKKIRSVKKQSKWQQIKNKFKNFKQITEMDNTEAIKENETVKVHKGAADLKNQKPKQRVRSNSVFTINTAAKDHQQFSKTLLDFEDNLITKRRNRSKSLADIKSFPTINSDGSENIDFKPDWIIELEKKALKAQESVDNNDSFPDEDNKSLDSVELDCDFHTILEDPKLFECYLKAENVNLVNYGDQTDESLVI